MSNEQSTVHMYNLFCDMVFIGCRHDDGLCHKYIDTHPRLFHHSHIAHHEESLLPYLTTKIDVDVILFLLVAAGILTSAVICNLPAIHEFLF